jgi:hypothetical protein
MNDWQIAVQTGLSAHFRQPNGPARPGIDWIILLTNGTETKKILVRDYLDDTAGRSQEQSGKSAVEFVGNLLRTGWTPKDYKGQPGELIVPARS